ncbi:hypothetical protein Droror1_Dr00010528 [Drosera rotundifolia]
MFLTLTHIQTRKCWFPRLIPVVGQASLGTRSSHDETSINLEGLSSLDGRRWSSIYNSREKFEGALPMLRRFLIADNNILQNQVSKVVAATCRPYFCNCFSFDDGGLNGRVHLLGICWLLGLLCGCCLLGCLECCKTPVGSKCWLLAASLIYN